MKNKNRNVKLENIKIGDIVLIKTWQPKYDDYFNYRVTVFSNERSYIRGKYSVLHSGKRKYGPTISFGGFPINEKTILKRCKKGTKND